MARQSINADSEKMHNLLGNKNIDLDNYRKLIKSYVELVRFNNLSIHVKVIELFI